METNKTIEIVFKMIMLVLIIMINYGVGTVLTGDVKV